MTNMYPTRFGYCVPIFAWPGSGLFRTPGFAALEPSQALTTAWLADALGYDSIWVADHLMLGHEQSILEGWTTLAAIAGSTSRARLGIIHQGHYFRHPAVAAKMIATLDQLSGGRFIYFADTGTRLSEHRAYGLHYPEDVRPRMDDFLEGLDLTLKLWASSESAPLTFEGKFYHVHEAVCAPPPVQLPHPPIWFGEAHPITLDACARLGQGWNSVPVGLETMKTRLSALREACANVGRDFSTLEISYETQILMAPTRDGVREQLRMMLALTPDGAPTLNDAGVDDFIAGRTAAYPSYLTDAWLVGTPDEVAGQIETYRALGVSHFMLWFMDAPRAEGMTLFMEQVAPRFRG
ncbi:MAG: LLM class flavin-dependent oxidoreductase [Pleurocapsa minor GSE-CHR-MK-17-07R]|jgi:alkanesulfonate monooxygenase SsuD/methylene tetrahydromethanopterin reductase-like flavin-dependent oxidoreductase (luciferase family)|nr:LLM class flavin-dependent oxidoreductase [Pleurocapsa minor GSE-CHR-MK 17-07R]